MEVVRLGKHDVVIGLEWEQIPVQGNSTSRAVAMVARKYKRTKYGLVMQSGSQRSVALAVGVAKKPSAPSAAAMLALAHEVFLNNESSGSLSASQATNWVVIEPLPNGRYWMVTSVDALVPTHGERILAEEDLLNELEQDAKISSLHATPNIFTTSQELGYKISERLPMVSVQARDWADLVKSVDTKGAMLRQVAGVRREAVLVLVVGTALLVGGYGYQHWREEILEHMRDVDAARAAAEALAKTHAAQAAYGKTIQASLDKALATGFKSLNQALVSPTPATQMAQWVAWAGAQPVDQAGWLVSGWKCAANAPAVGGSACTVLLARGSDSLRSEMIRRFPEAKITGASAEIPSSLPTLDNRTGTSWKTLPWTQSVRMPWMVMFEFLSRTGLKYQQSASNPVSVSFPTPPPPGARFKPGSAKSTPASASVDTGIASGTIVMHGGGVWSAEGVIQYLDAANLKLDRIEVHAAPAGPEHWTMEWTYWIRTAPGPKAPVVQGVSGPLHLIIPPKYQVVPWAGQSPHS